MKNLVVKISLLFVLAIMSSVVSVQAQSFRQYKANIPFDFTIGKKTYEAGNYVINVRNLNQVVVVLSVKNTETRDSLEMAVPINGSRSLVDKTVLMFDRYGDQYILTQMVSTDFGLSAPKSKINKRSAKKSGKVDESVAVVLVERDESIN